MSGVHRRRSSPRRRSHNGPSLSGCCRGAASRCRGRFGRSSGDCEETSDSDLNGSVGDGKQNTIEQWVNDGIVWKKGGIRDGLKVDSHIFNWRTSTKVKSVISIVDIVNIVGSSRVVGGSRRIRHTSRIWNVRVLACDQAGIHCPILMLLGKQVVIVEGTCAGREEGQPWPPHTD